MPLDRLSILFVCLGNICRSPAAEGVMQKIVDDRGLAERIAIDSAGTSGYHIGSLADGRMRRAAAARGLQLTSRARMIAEPDLARFDWIIAMDRDNLRELTTLSQGPSPKLRLLSDYLDDAWPTDVPDPYYGGTAGFERVLDMLTAACPNLLDEMLRGAQPPLKPRS